MFLNEDENLTEDEDFGEFMLLVHFPRKRKTFLERPNHFSKRRYEQFSNISSHQNLPFDIFYTRLKIAYPLPPIEIMLFLWNTNYYLYYGLIFSSLWRFIGVSKSAASDIIWMVLRRLAFLKQRFLNFPASKDEIDDVKQGFYNIAKFPKCIGALDCTHVRIKSPGGEDAEIYRNRKGYFSINVQTIYDSELRIQNILCTWPRSTHDSTIFNHSAIRGKFERGEMGDSILVGDSGYPLKKYLMTPFQNVLTVAQNLCDESQVRIRNPIERSYRVWKKRFPILAVGINVHLNTVESITVATAD